MRGINEILNKAMVNEELTEAEKFKILNSKNADPKVIEYLMDKFKSLHIEVLSRYEGDIFELMPTRILEGWCWETTESAIVFLNDEDYIERGNLKLDKQTPEYYHSWICFKFDDNEYVLDPCLNLLCQKKDYTKLFETETKGRVTAKKVKEELIRQITTPKPTKTSCPTENYDSLMRKILGDSYDDYMEKNKTEVTIRGIEDVNAPIYRNNSGYKAEIENGKIKKLTVHYYDINC